VILCKERQLLYVATDETYKKFFDLFVNSNHDLRFLDDYWELANLSSFRKEHLGMIEVIVASRGRVFVGTYYSTFSGYISRIRGYYGMSKYTNYYGWKVLRRHIKINGNCKLHGLRHRLYCRTDTGSNVTPPTGATKTRTKYINLGIVWPHVRCVDACALSVRGVMSSGTEAHAECNTSRQLPIIINNFPGLFRRCHILHESLVVCADIINIKPQFHRRSFFRDKAMMIL
jgi:hypothetical protein